MTNGLYEGTDIQMCEAKVHNRSQDWFGTVTMQHKSFVLNTTTMEKTEILIDSSKNVNFSVNYSFKGDLLCPF